MKIKKVTEDAITFDNGRVYAKKSCNGNKGGKFMKIKKVTEAGEAKAYDIDYDEVPISDLEETMAKVCKAAYYRGHLDGFIKADKSDKSYKDNDAIQEAYNNGLQDAWECAKKIVFIPEDGGYSIEELRNVFDKRQSIHEISEKYSVQEVVSRIKYHEKKRIDDIKVGDEVYYMDENHPRVVTAIDEVGGIVRAWLITEDGKYIVHNLADLHRTGNHYVNVESMLNDLKGE